MILFFFFNDTATTEIYTLSLHDALPISPRDAAVQPQGQERDQQGCDAPLIPPTCHQVPKRSEEHTSELQSRLHLVCRLLLEKKKYKITHINYHTIQTSQSISRSVHTILS